MAIHDIGDVVVLWAVFRDEAGVQTDPTGVTLIVREPQGDVIEVMPVEAAAEDEARAEAATGQVLVGVTGVYRAEIEVTQGGRYRYRWEGTGSVDESEAGGFYVRRDLVGAAGS